jgi:hypothetical protein
MRTYRATYQRGQVVPLEAPEIPEGSDLIVTVLEGYIPDNRLARQNMAVNEFLSAMQQNDEPLGDDFDEIISRRFNTSRGLQL